MEVVCYVVVGVSFGPTIGGFLVFICLGGLLIDYLRNNSSWSRNSKSARMARKVKGIHSYRLNVGRDYHLLESTPTSFENVSHCCSETFLIRH